MYEKSWRAVWAYSAKRAARDGKTLPLPSAYAVPDDLQGDERQAWLRELVEWWQLDRSQLEPRIPYLHGARLRRYGGKIDQIARIIALLRTKPSTRLQPTSQTMAAAITSASQSVAAKCPAAPGPFMAAVPMLPRQPRPRRASRGLRRLSPAKREA